MNALLAASAAFFLLHMLPSTPLRPRLVAVLGQQAYLGAFSLAAAITLWWSIHAFWAVDPTGRFWAVPAWWLWIKAALILFAFILIVGGLLTPNPSVPGGDKVLARRDAAGGIFAITRHPFNWGVAIWAIAHLVSQATVRGFVFFGMFAAMALIGSWLQQRRKRAELSGWSSFEAKTSFLPFAAILQGRAALSLKAIGWWQIAVAAILWAAILHFHMRWFGAQPLPFLS